MESDKPKYRPVPPTSGQWKPGQSGNPSGRPKSKPFKDALQKLIDNNPDALNVAAAALMARAHTGDVSAMKEIADRLDGKVPQAIGGTDELPAIKGFAWLDYREEPKVIEHVPEVKAIEGATSLDAARDSGDRTVPVTSPEPNNTTHE